MRKWNDYIDGLVALKNHDPETYMQYGTSMLLNGMLMGVSLMAIPILLISLL